MIIRSIIDTRRANKEGLFPVKIRISDKGAEAYISLDIYADPKDFNKSMGLFISKKKNLLYQQYNNLINTILIKLDDIRLDGVRNNIYYSPAKIRDIYLEELNSKKEIKTESFTSYFLRFAKSKKGRTQIVYITTYNKLLEYYPEELQFSDITHSWLTDFDEKMQNASVVNSKKEEIRKGLRPNSRSIHFRNIRAVFNHAIDNEVIGLELYPFRRFKIPHQKTAKRAIHVSVLSSILNFDGTPEENWAVDMAKLIFYLIGINVKDLFYLNEYDGEYIYYSRAKTSRPYIIRVEPEIKHLFEKYKGNKTLFNFQDKFYLHESFTKKINKYLAKICNKLEVNKITTYSLRHTWATLAAELDIPKETIAAALGHEDGAVTNIYIDFNRKKIHEANRKVIDYVLYNKM